MVGDPHWVTIHEKVSEGLSGSQPDHKPAELCTRKNELLILGCLNQNHIWSTSLVNSLVIPPYFMKVIDKLELLQRIETNLMIAW